MAKKNGSTTVLRQLKVGRSVTRAKGELSAAKNLHGIAHRLGIKVTLRTDGDDVTITRTK